LPDLNGCYWVISIHENTHPDGICESKSIDESLEEKEEELNKVRTVKVEMESSFITNNILE
ncbi:hypothetical protein, partial [Providencia stuartii]|uniref:hypothetical protein n=1 Tax=Providencia stuartii TaxID=588 RepID=UPI001C58DE72